MQEIIADNRQIRKYAIILLMVVLSGCEGCASKEAALTVQEQITHPVLEIPFVGILDNYFYSNDTSGFIECVGKVVTYEEMTKADEKYTTSGGLLTYRTYSPRRISFPARKPKGDVTSGKYILYTITGIGRPDGLTDFLILDITSLEGRSGNDLAKRNLLRQEEAIDPNDFRYISEVPNYFGIFEYKFSDGLPFDTRIIPKWIVTANEEGKISITEPLDDKWFIYISNEP
jgi:hypothetical protein